jgi:predicted 3-demethylubiquinone-9 3-methyltransferase (glyoxalase superfamily)
VRRPFLSRGEYDQMPKITPFLWFDHQAEAANFYVSVFPNARIVKVARYGADEEDRHRGAADSLRAIGVR